MPETLVSEKNPLMKEVRRAIARGSLTGNGFAVAEGFHLLEEALRSRCEIAAAIAVSGVQDDLLARLPKTTRVIEVSERIFKTVASTETPQGVVALIRPPAWTLDQLISHRSLIVILDGIQDPGNAGSIVRAAEAFRASGVVFLKGSVNPYNPKALRASAGSIFRLPVVAGMEAGPLASELMRTGIRIYSALPRAERTIAAVDLKERCAIAIGAEGHGVGEILRRAATGARIPTCGVESLNAAVAAGILLYEASRQREAFHEPL
ncbi:MAG TPA: RNA methyltransferase [Bryobacteraceae bacterium]|jgi:TrmH family RNA methyltransferase